MPDEYLGAGVGLDTTPFKAGVTELKAQVRQIETSFRASAAVMGDWSRSTEGLTGRTTSLEEKLKLQKQALSTLNAEYRKASEEQGANSKAAQSLANQMYSMEKQISSTENDLKKYSNQLKDVKSKSDGMTFKKFNDGLAGTSEAASKALKGISMFVGGAVAALGGLLGSSMENADELQKLSDVTGFTAEQLQVMRYQGSALGVELDAMTGAQSRLIKAMAAASIGKSGPNAQAKAFQALGIQVRDSSGHLRDSNTVFNEVITKLGGMKSETDRDALAIQLFGKSAMNLNPLIKAGGDQLAQMADEAKKSGAVMSNDAVSGLDNFGDSVDAMKLSLQGLIGSAFGKLTPQLNDMTAKIKDLDLSKVTNIISWALDHLPQIGMAISGITGAVVAWKVAAVTANVVSGISNALMVTSKLTSEGAAAAQIALKAATGSTTLAQLALNAAWLANPVTLVVAGIAALVAAFVILWNNCEGFRRFWVGLWNGMKGAAQATGNWFRGPFVNFFTSAGNNIRNGFNSTINWIRNNWKQLALFLVNPIAGAVALLYNNNPKFRAWANSLGSAIRNGFNNAIRWIRSLPSEALQWGRDIIMGIVNGIKRAASAVRDAVNGVAQNIRSFLHFSVPDEGPLADFESWMPDFMAGLAQGIEKSKFKVRNAIQALSTDISVGVNPRPSGVLVPAAAGGGVGGGATINNYNLSQTIQGAKDTSPSENARQLRNFARQLSLKNR